MKKLNVFTLLALVMGLFVQTSCNKDDETATAQMNIRLTDAPCDYDSVLVDVQQIEIKSSGGDVTLAVKNPGIYNLLDFNNGLDTLLVSKDLPVGNVSQIRLILGNENYVVVNGVRSPMATPSAQQSGLKLNVQVNLTAGITYDLWLDFDACKSVVEQGNGSYILKPVIRTFTEANSGAIAGMVSPANSVLYTYVVSGTDTLGTIPNVYGEFMIGGVPPGTYTVYFDAAPPFLNQTVSNVTVTVGNITQMGTISF